MSEEKDKEYNVLLPDLQLGVFYRLKEIKKLYFHEALSKSINNVDINVINDELRSYVSDDSIKKLAIYSLRGEVLFPIPILLRENPYLISYYRLLLGFSQKEFYSKGPFGVFKSMEEKGKLSKQAENLLLSLCKSLIKTAQSFLEQIDSLSLNSIAELQLLTVGPQLRGSMNNQYGSIATQRTFDFIKEIVHKQIKKATPYSIEILNDSERKVKIQFSSDPDIEIIEELHSGNRGLISIEIKGGRDFSNIHNRIGEAEKSHQKAKRRGYFEFMTIVSVDIDYQFLKHESPTTSHFFHLDKLLDANSSEAIKFKEIISSILGIRIS